MQRVPLMLCNWKMHGANGLAHALFTALADLVPGGVELVALPPFPYLADAQRWLHATDVRWGAQAVHPQHEGAFTGEVGASMLRELGCRYVLIGHSERRQGRGEDNTWISQQLEAVWSHHMIPVLCVGEGLEARQAGEAEQVVCAQLEVLAAHMADRPLVVGYEPVWAIGTGQVPAPSEVQAMHQALRQNLGERLGEAFATRARIVYGGSLKPSNAAALLGLPDVDGGLVGGASLDPRALEEMLTLCQSLLSPSTS